MRERTSTVTRGTIKVRRHCTFRWWRVDRWWHDEQELKTVEIEHFHCAACVAALEKLGRGELSLVRVPAEASAAHA